MKKSPYVPAMLGLVFALLAGLCWAMQLSPGDSGDWNEKARAVHYLNNSTEIECMNLFTLLAVSFSGVALYRWLRYGRQTNGKEAV